MKKIFSIIIAAVLLSGLTCAAAIDEGQSRAVVGASLSDTQIEAVYKSFGVERGTVTELTVSNSEEREYLEGLVDESIIGTRSISCVYIETLAAGSGLDITVENISWCTRETYMNALVTAGIDDAKVIVAAPISVSGTAALTGIYKAYEDITGEKLDELAKFTGTQELVITSELAEEIGSYDAASIVNELKLILDETETMTDEDLKGQISSLAKEYNVEITDSQTDKLVSLCRSFEGLSTEQLTQKVQDVQDTIKKLADAQEKVTTTVGKVKSVVESVVGFFDNLIGYFKKN